MDVSFSSHHVAVSVRNLETSRAFYEFFGFREVATWAADDGRLTIQHLALPDGFALELFAFATSTGADALELTPGNDLTALGVKHFGLRVSDIHAARAGVVERGFTDVTDVTRGRHPVDYFFVRDPDGNWLEIVQDERVLDVDQPMRLGG